MLIASSVIGAQIEWKSIARFLRAGASLSANIRHERALVSARYQSKVVSDVWQVCAVGSEKKKNVYNELLYKWMGRRSKSHHRKSAATTGTAQHNFCLVVISYVNINLDENMSECWVRLKTTAKTLETNIRAISELTAMRWGAKCTRMQISCSRESSQTAQIANTRRAGRGSPQLRNCHSKTAQSDKLMGAEWNKSLESCSEYQIRPWIDAHCHEPSSCRLYRR